MLKTAPVIAKEVGYGISSSVAKKLAEAGDIKIEMLGMNENKRQEMLFCWSI